MANFGGKFRTIICELSLGKCYSHKCHRQVFLGQTGKELMQSLSKDTCHFFNKTDNV